MADKLYNEASIQAIADAIRAKSGKTDTMKVSEMAGEINDLEAYSLDDIFKRNFVGDIVYNGTSAIPAFAFLNCKTLTSFSAPNVTIIDGTTSRGYYQNTESSIFSGCTNLKSISLPSVVNYWYAGYAFKDCTSIQNWGLAFDKIEQLAGNLFYGCTTLPSLVLPSLTTGLVYSNCFYGCTNMQYLDGKIQRFYSTSCQNCTSLNLIILRGITAVTTLSNINAFQNTPFASGKSGGTLYVPQALLSDFESATNWSTILSYTNNKILSIEGSIYETQYADGTPVETGGDS